MDKKKLLVGVAAASVLTIGGGGAALAAQQQGASTGQENEPAVTGTVAAPEAKGEQNDAAETQQLQGLAKIDQKAAEQAALGAVPGGTVQKAKLGDENGSVVYDVEVLGKDGKTTEVKVDAGNGQVLSQETGDNEGPQGSEANDANESGASK